ncbi:hypothetical protein LTR66_003627 [Elasticomyces elasticus]|nr:hypothetical protein LTR50_001380 [Elasticomyces elasticus]KAK4996840.1 hypothetical protein LTR66_003627 [Elasticomyces elasticus]
MQSSKPAEHIDDPLNPLVSAACLDLLLIELVPLAHRVTTELAERDAKLFAEQENSIFFGNGRELQRKRAQARMQDGEGTAVAGMEAGAEGAGAKTGMAVESMSIVDDEETREAVFWRLEGMGYRVGLGMAERFSANRPLISTPLDAIKFICKDLWTLCFKKQIDNLKTNHRGIYVLTDTRFHPLTRMSVDRNLGARGLEALVKGAQPVRLSFLVFCRKRKRLTSESSSFTSHAASYAAHWLA